VDVLKSKSRNNNINIQSNLNIIGTLNTNSIMVKNKPFVKYNKKHNSFEFQ
jgi:hypothetical protein